MVAEADVDEIDESRSGPQPDDEIVGAGHSHERGPNMREVRALQISMKRQFPARAVVLRKVKVKGIELPTVRPSSLAALGAQHAQTTGDHHELAQLVPDDSNSQRELA